MDLHRGFELTVDSEGHNRGSSFTLSMPVCFLAGNVSYRSSEGPDRLKHLPSMKRVELMPLIFRRRDIRQIGDAVDATLHRIDPLSIQHNRSSGPETFLKEVNDFSAVQNFQSSQDEENEVPELVPEIDLNMRFTAESGKTEHPPAPTITSSLSLLVVDDAPMSRKMVVRHMKHQCGTIDEAEDGAIAVEMMAKAIADGHPYDFVLMDYQMPVMDGPTSAREMRVMGYKGPIIGVTGNAADTEIQTFYTKGANAVLKKPLDVQRLVDILQGK